MQFYCISWAILILLSQRVKTQGTKVRISSSPSDMDPYDVIDGNKKTFVQSIAQGDPFPTLNITYHESRTIESVMLYFYRYGDASCSNNPDDCQSTWQRLWGLKVSVGIVEQGEESLIECGSVPEYEPPKFDATKEPEPLLKTVVCEQEITGNWIVIQQTLENQVLQFSEIVFVHDWKVLSSDTKNPFLWDNHPLEIKTDKSRISIKATVDPNSSLLPSYTNMSIGLTIDLHRGSVEMENHATNTSEEMKFAMPHDLQGDSELIWTLFKLNRKLHITLDGVEVWEMDYIKLFDTQYDNGIFSQRSMKAWSKRVQEICLENESEITGKLPYRKSGKCFSGYQMTRDKGCVECPKNTYSSYGAMSCTACPDGTHSPAGSDTESDCQSAGYLIPIQTVLVNDYYPDDNPADDSNKPSNMFDGDPNTFYHARWGSDDPGMEIFFGSQYTISYITFIPRYNNYLRNNENTIFSIIKENGETEECGMLTGTNKESETVTDQTYQISCSNKQGVGLKVWRTKVNAWCPAEVKIFYKDDRECTGLNTEKHKDLTTETSFPVPRGTEVQVECTTGYTNPAGAALKCLEGTEFSESTEIKCSFPGGRSEMY